MAEGVDDWTPILFTKMILRHDVEISTFLGKEVILQIDEAYTIGKSIAVIFDENVIGHVDRSARRVVWRFLRSKSKLQANVYVRVGEWCNQSCLSVVTHSQEIGLRIRFNDLNRSDAKFLLAHFTRKRMYSFPGVGVMNCPDVLRPFIYPCKDENGVSSLVFGMNMPVN